MTKRAKIRVCLSSMRDYIGLLDQARATLTALSEIREKQAAGRDLNLHLVEQPAIQKMRYGTERIAKEIQVLEELMGG